ncbi:MAG TPA: DinB family protein [Cytophagales bacterium]|nr:DinB family protein [Cytophagales bacterium]
MKEYLIRLYKYNHWANERYFTLFKTLNVIPERIQLLLSHTIVAQKLWLSRIQGNPDFSLHIWKTLPLNEVEQMAKENTTNWLNYLKSSDEQEFSRILSYINFQKIPYETVISDIIIHTANHATYHRAQYAILLRQNNIDPPNTDFITYSREVKE